jgi:hypothetical protein
MRRFDQRLIVKEAIAGGGNRRATEDLSRRFSHLRLSKVEVGVVRIGAVIHRVATLEDGSSGHALTEKPFECGSAAIKSSWSATLTQR